LRGVSTEERLLLGGDYLFWAGAFRQERPFLEAMGDNPAGNAIVWDARKGEDAPQSLGRSKSEKEDISRCSKGGCPESDSELGGRSASRKKKTPGVTLGPPRLSLAGRAWRQEDSFSLLRKGWDFKIGGGGKRLYFMGAAGNNVLLALFVRAFAKTPRGARQQRKRKASLLGGWFHTGESGARSSKGKTSF